MLTEPEAIERAKQLAVEQGWAWVEPVEAILRRAWFGEQARWEISSNVAGRGPMARFVIDAHTGAVIEQGYIPR